MSDHSDKKRNDKLKMNSVISWNSGGNLSNNPKINDFLRYGSISSASENSCKIIMPAKGILSNFLVKLTPSMGNGNANPGDEIIRTFIVRKNGIDTSLKINITGNHVHGESNMEIHVEKCDLISLVHSINNTTSNSAIGIASVILSHK